MSEATPPERSDSAPNDHNPEADGEDAVVNPVLARLIEEVRNEGAKGDTTYDRVHNRHNR